MTRYCMITLLLAPVSIVTPACAAGKRIALVDKPPVVVAGKNGYDGGPFFSPDGKHLCYRSDRGDNDLLQVFVSELDFDKSGSVRGVKQENQLTNNEHVNWAPFWHPNGKLLVYTSSQLGHRNYEIFLMRADNARIRPREWRVTHTDRFDGLPAFNTDASVMIWTSQRGDGGSSQLWAADFHLPLQPGAATAPADQNPMMARTILKNFVQLTFPDRFAKAGESYFSPDDSKVIFQAIPVAKADQASERFYQMYVADVARDKTGRITGFGDIKRLSPPGSSNTCGWFHPTLPNIVIFGSTIVAPSDPGKSGYQRGNRSYVWQFPKEMTIVQCDMTEADSTAATLYPLVVDPEAYLAECVISPDGRHLIYTRRPVLEGKSGGDLFIAELKIVGATP